GAYLTYTITATNNGPSAVTQTVVSDSIPAGTHFVSVSPAAGCAGPTNGDLTCTIASMAWHQSATYSLVVQADSANLPGTVITNTATVASDSGSDPTVPDAATVTTTVNSASADLSVTKAASAALVLRGSELTYTIGVGNAGPSEAVNTVLSDTVP